MSRVSKKWVVSGVLVALALVQLPALAQEGKPVGPALTPRLRQLLSEEMRAVKQASEQILTGLTTGDHALVENMAQQIHDSFILKRSLTENDKKELKKALPPAFLHMDGAFHGTAKKLAEAARHKDRELELYYYSRMLEGCQTCHAQYATDRFPGFSGRQAEAHAH